jgi:prolyl-tRNA synthetase
MIPTSYSKTTQRRPQINLSKDHSSLSIEEWMLNASFIVKSDVSGFPVFMPSAQKVIGKLKQTIRDEVEKIGFQEFMLPALYPTNLFESSGRDFGNTTFVIPREKDDYMCSATHEEWLSQFFSDIANVGHIHSKNLPIKLFQFGKIWRDISGKGLNKSAKGLLKTSEFELFESYTLCRNEMELTEVINEVDEVYFSLFNRLGIENLFYFDHRIVNPGEERDTKRYTDFLMLNEKGEYKFFIDASGNIFDTPGLCDLCDTNLSQKRNKIYTCQNGHESDYPGKSYLNESKLKLQRMFTIGMTMRVEDCCTEPFNLTYKDGKENHNIIMGTHGIGLLRLIMALYDNHHDKNGMNWPLEIAPFSSTIIPVREGDLQGANLLYQQLKLEGHDCIIDDRHNLNHYPKTIFSEFVGIPFSIKIDESGKRYSLIPRGRRGDEIYRSNNVENMVDTLKERFIKK